VSVNRVRCWLASCALSIGCQMDAVWVLQSVEPEWGVVPVHADGVPMDLNAVLQAQAATDPALLGQSGRTVAAEVRFRGRMPGARATVVFETLRMATLNTDGAAVMVDRIEQDCLVERVSGALVLQSPLNEANDVAGSVQQHYWFDGRNIRTGGDYADRNPPLACLPEPGSMWRCAAPGNVDYLFLEQGP